MLLSANSVFALEGLAPIENNLEEPLILTAFDKDLLANLKQSQRNDWRKESFNNVPISYNEAREMYQINERYMALLKMEVKWGLPLAKTKILNKNSTMDFEVFKQDVLNGNITEIREVSFWINYKTHVIVIDRIKI